MKYPKHLWNLIFQHSHNNSPSFTLTVPARKMTTTNNYQGNCIFCKILRKEEPGESVYENEDIVCIKDINPASTHHYLIIPKIHIANAKVLKKENEELYDKMIASVDVISDRFGLEKSSLRTGFHWPPFTTVGHLHLHVISPVENMSFVKNIMFKPNSLWFVSTDYVKSRF
ncbi:PREDICTED: histidine triad nucleotide-binding protein 3-like [Ceratosolen solmsi marchali]|uniref:Adenosine 5'-monophosphoramidase HINT3 n=1 Tax=Ceratosolen solmsi marchali TaxID=326594 RepID=A0AAJ6YX51_9HYME|nr:PREDICTED: histidine triad nucleotide-binding protein 3-like [Ceratosolen solmsi marchali]